MAKSEIGDIIEIKTAKGLAFGQFTHQDKVMGSLLRILPGFYDVRPSDLETLSAHEQRFHVFFPLEAAISRGIVQVVGNAPIPAKDKAFPVFCSRSEPWWLWDGTREWRVQSLEPEQRKFPIRATWNYAMLVSRLESGWSPEEERRNRSPLAE